MKFFSSWPTTLLALISQVDAVKLDLTSAASIRQASSQIAFDLMSIYTGNRTGDVPGNLPAPFFWWEAGAMFGTMINYWYYTGDTTYNAVTSQALLHQVGPQNNYMPPNQTNTMGNDDQSFWAMSAMLAAEVNFPNPPADQPQWLALAQAVFNSQVPRWDPATCNGGLRWQVFQFNQGFDYKNSISNGALFNLGARLARYTGNNTYADWAEKVWDWLESVHFIDADYNVFDGAGVPNCTQIVNLQWTYNVGIMLHGAANMYNYTNGSQIWRDRTQGLLNATGLFFINPGEPDVMVEVACENNDLCNNDQQSFKAYLSRWMAQVTQIAPFTTAYVKEKLAGSATAAAQQCSGGTTGTKCGLKWVSRTTWDGTTGPGQQMAALEVVQANMLFLPSSSSSTPASPSGSPSASSAGGANNNAVPLLKGPVTANDGGTSKGDPSAGTVESTWSGNMPLAPITNGDRAGAAFVTIFAVGIISGLGILAHMD